MTYRPSFTQGNGLCFTTAHHFLRSVALIVYINRLAFYVADENYINILNIEIILQGI